jgi:capsular exopolysaccharide synthesis family protein
LLAFVVLVPLVAAIAVHRAVPRYTATGTVMLESSAYAVQELQSILRTDPASDAVMASQAEIVRSSRLAERLLDRMALGEREEFNPALRPPSGLERLGTRLRDWLAPSRAAPAAAPELALASREALIQAAQNAIAVQTVRSSRVMTVSFTSEDRALAARAANFVMELYLADQLEAKVDAVTQANGWLESRIGELRRDVQSAEDRIAAYRADSGLVQGVQAGLETEQMSKLTAELLEARNDLAQAEGRLDVARGRAGAAAQAAISPSVAPLRTHQDELAGQLQSLLARLGPNHLDAVSLRNQLAEAQRAVGGEIARVVAATDAEVRADRSRVAALEATAREAQAHIDRDAQAQVPLNAMQRDADASRTQLHAILERVQQTAQQAALEKPDARIISPALLPTAPSFPRTGPTLVAALASGVFLGGLAVYLRELAEATIRSGDEVRTLLGLPCFALIPEVGRRQLRGSRIEDFVVTKPLSPFAEQMRGLRAGLWLGARRPRVIAVTAARPSEGKTVTTIALARSAALAGERVAVIDCDIRQPSLGRFLRADGDLGIVDTLLGRAPLDDVIRHEALGGLDFIVAGTVETNALGLFMSEAMTACISRLRATHDLVLLDAPPVIALADARVIAALADATLLCVRWHDTPRAVVRNCLELLQDADAAVVGVALTRVDTRVHVRSGFADAEVYHPRYGGYFSGSRR